jgi:hypothetical protein
LPAAKLFTVWGLANSREQQEIVTLSLQLLQNCLMLINTILVEQTIEREGVWERISAKIFEHRHRCSTDTSIPMDSLPSTSTVRHFSRLPDHLQTASKQMAARLTVSV